MAEPIVRLAERIFRIPTLGDYVNSYALVEDDGSVTLIDCGTKRAPAKVVAGLAAIGKAPGDVQRIVLTHAHEDHAGGAAAMVGRASVDGVEAHADEASYLREGRRPPTDQTLTSGRIFGRITKGGFAPIPVTRELGDGDVVDAAGGLTVHHTPGHSPGHVSLLHRESGVLITGDAIWNMRRRMSWPTSAFCTSHVLNRASARVLGELEYSIAAFTHGPEIRDGAREAIRGFLTRAGVSS